MNVHKLGYKLYSHWGWTFALFISENGSQVFIYVSVLRMRNYKIYYLQSAMLFSSYLQFFFCLENVMFVIIKLFFLRIGENGFLLWSWPTRRRVWKCYSDYPRRIFQFGRSESTRREIKQRLDLIHVSLSLLKAWQGSCQRFDVEYGYYQWWKAQACEGTGGL